MRDKRKWADAGGSHVGVLLLSKTGIEGHVVFTFQSALKMANPFPSKKKKKTMANPLILGHSMPKLQFTSFPELGHVVFQF